MIIGIKDVETFDSLRYEWHPALNELFKWLCKVKDHVVVTCGYEKRNYPSVHSVLPLRGLDIRSWIYRDPKDLCDIINGVWQYDPKRPGLKVATYHDSGRGHHIHLQVHERTVRL